MMGRMSDEEVLSTFKQHGGMTRAFGKVLGVVKTLLDLARCELLRL